MSRTKKEEKSFEEHLKALEGIVAELEEGNLTLQESLNRYQEGMKHLQICLKFLQEAEQTIEEVTRDEDGQLRFRPMAAGEGDS